MCTDNLVPIIYDTGKFPFVEAIRFYREQLILIDCSSLVLEVICFVRFDEAVRLEIFINPNGKRDDRPSRLPKVCSWIINIYSCFFGSGRESIAPRPSAEAQVKHILTVLPV